MEHLKPLPWDSDHFGFPVAQITCPDLDDGALVQTLAAAHRKGVRLVYWPTHSARVVPEPILQAFGGRLVDRKATFQRDLAPDQGGSSGQGRLNVFAHPKGPASQTLIDLAIAAGEYSRFKVDPRIPGGKFQSLYEAWIQGSTRGRLADEVLVASLGAAPLSPVGMITLARRGNFGVIGLIAVLETARGQGVGSFLIRESHRWMKAQGLSFSSVVTQLDNAPACTLYERCGYHLKETENYFHFWPASQ